MAWQKDKPNAVNRAIGRIIRETGQKQGEVADRAGLSRAVFSNIVRCKRKVYADEVLQIAAALQVSVEDLFQIKGGSAVEVLKVFAAPQVREAARPRFASDDERQKHKEMMLRQRLYQLIQGYLDAGMTPSTVIAKVIKSVIRWRGMTITEVAKMTDIPYNKLQPSLNGLRELRPDEFLELCSLLRIDPYLFIRTVGGNNGKGKE